MERQYERAEPRAINIQREVGEAVEEAPLYIDPPHLMFTDYIPNPDHAVLTSVCWLLAKRPESVQVLTPTIQERTAANLTNARASPLTVQALAFIGMGGLMTLVKEVKGKGDRANYEYLYKRWKALCATCGAKNVIESKELPPSMLEVWIERLESWQNWIKPRQLLRVALIDLCLLHKEGTHGATSFTVAIMEQVKMVYQYYGMKSVMLMDAFPNTNNKAILLVAIASQAVTLRKTLAKYKTKYGEYFPYMRVYPLDGTEEIYHRLYPDLYYAAISNAIHHRQLGGEGRYQMTQVSTTIPRAQIDEYLDQKLRTTLGISDQTKKDLAELGLHVDEEDFEEEPPRLRRRV